MSWLDRFKRSKPAPKPKEGPRDPWTTGTLRELPQGLSACAYYEWVWATDFAYYGKAHWLPVLVELRVSLQQFAGLVFEMQAREESQRGWAAQLRIPPFLKGPWAALFGPTQVIAVLATRAFLDDVYAGNEPANLISRFELGRSGGLQSLASLTTSAPWPPPSGSTGQLVVTGIIDDGIAFAHDRFLSANGSTRIEAHWDQQMPGGAGVVTDKATIDALRVQCSHGPLVDEDELYRRSGHVDPAKPGHQPLASRVAHGTHVLDLACNGGTLPAPDPWPIIAVQLPSATVADTSGATLESQVLWGLWFIFLRAWGLAVQAGRKLSLVVNISYGTIAGPHDGSGLLEVWLDKMLAVINATQWATLRIVLPAGNNRQSRCHACFSLASGGRRMLAWRVLPDDRTESWVEIWLPAGTDTSKLSVEVTAPDGLSTTQPFFAGTFKDLAPQAAVVAKAAYFAQTPPVRSRILLQLAPTADFAGALALAPAGVWQIELHNTATAAVNDIHAWIQRDDTAPGHQRRGRQSYFDDPDYARFDAGGRAIENDTHALTSASYVKRDGTFNAIATGKAPIVVGGFRRSDAKAATYSASGPVVHPPGRGVPNPGGPEAMLPSDDAPSQPGLLAAGTRSGSCVAMQGTSVAAPLAARWVAGRMAAGSPSTSDRQALFEDAQTKDTSPNPPHATRGGGGRLPMPADRLPR